MGKMCSISGVISKKQDNVFNHLMESLFDLKHRGSDSFGVSVNGRTVTSKSMALLRKKFVSGSAGIAHSRLEITGKQFQPLQFGNKSIAFNGQIYNFFEFTESDSDVIFLKEFFEQELKNNSIEKAVNKFMQKANGEYAVAILWNKKIYVFRDLFGIKPVWFGENDFFVAFSSEPKPLKKMNINFPLPLLPGSLLILSEKGIEVKKVFSFDLMKKKCSFKASFSDLKKSFFESIFLRTRNLNKAGIFFSGGVDSTTSAALVKKAGIRSRLLLIDTGFMRTGELIKVKKMFKKLGFNLILLDKKQYF